jgi:hypothetical protein
VLSQISRPYPVDARKAGRASGVLNVRAGPQYEHDACLVGKIGCRSVRNAGFVPVACKVILSCSSSSSGKCSGYLLRGRGRVPDEEIARFLLWVYGFYLIIQHALRIVLGAACLPHIQSRGASQYKKSGSLDAEPGSRACALGKRGAGAGAGLQARASSSSSSGGLGRLRCACTGA